MLGSWVRTPSGSPTLRDGATMNLTPIAHQVFRRRQRRIALYATHAEDFQREVFEGLISKAKDTFYGQRYGFGNIHTYDEFRRHVPTSNYETTKDYIDRMRRGEKDVLWPGQVRWYAKSSGTTNDKSKFIPISREGLRELHYRGSTDVVALYLEEHPNSRLFEGKSLMLGGSHAPNYNVAHSIVGDLSAVLLENMSPLTRSICSAITKSTSLMNDFEEKRTQIAREIMGQKIKSLSGVPSWMLSVLLRTLELSGASCIDELFPTLEVFFHGGISFAPYRPQYEKIIRNPHMVYMETYNASEGFFGIQNSQDDPSLLLMVDYGVFFEFCPIEAINAEGEVIDATKVVPLRGVEMGRNYAMIISTNCGLWRYVIGDTIRFTCLSPYKFTITGRTKSFINAFGEELIVDNAEKGLQLACKETGAEVLEYTAAPVFMGEDGKCRHQWLIEFSHRPDDLERFTSILDVQLQQINSDYEAKRFKDITLQHLEIVVAREGLFNDWLKSQGKLGGQHKVPRLMNNRHIIEKLLEMNRL